MRGNTYARSPHYKCRFRLPGFADLQPLAEALKAVSQLALQLTGSPALNDEERDQLTTVLHLAAETQSRLGQIIRLEDPEMVYFAEFNKKGRAKLCAKPLLVADFLAAELFGGTESVTLVSATLSTGGNFEFIRGQMGMPEGGLEAVAESPFDFRKQALLVLPDGLPEPGEPDFLFAAVKTFRHVFAACSGRTLGLFTSYRNLEAVHSRVTDVGHRVLRQGELPRTELTRIFKEDVSSVLLGTDSFWTGIDVPGEALTAVVIDRLPFSSPDDPIVSALSERNPNAFHDYIIPLAIIKLRQGVGRLIRTKTDIGVVVILDSRILTKSYARLFLRSLPPMRHTRCLEHIICFLEEAAYARAS